MLNQLIVYHRMGIKWKGLDLTIRPCFKVKLHLLTNKVVSIPQKFPFRPGRPGPLYRNGGTCLEVYLKS